MACSDADYAFLREVVQAQSANLIDPSRNALFDAKLTPIAKMAGASNLREFVRLLRTNRPTHLRNGNLVRIIANPVAKPGEMRNKAYYRALYDHVKSKSQEHIVVGNPGVAASSDWQVKRTKSQNGTPTGPVVDILVAFEGPTVRVEHADGVTGDRSSVIGYDTFTAPTWTSEYKAKRFAHLVYRASDSGTPSDRPTITSTCQASATRNAGVYLFTTDNLILPDDERPQDLDPGPAISAEDMNPWNTLPTAEMIACPTLHRREVFHP